MDIFKDNAIIRYPFGVTNVGKHTAILNIQSSDTVHPHDVVLPPKSKLSMNVEINMPKVKFK